jgi:hypothetical protein
MLLSGGIIALGVAAAHAQTPAPAPPCPTSSVLLTAKPIFGVGLTTIRNACPAFLSALDSWYAAHPFATVADAVAAIRGTPPAIAPPPVVVQPPPIVITSGSVGARVSVDFSKWSTAQIRDGSFWRAPNRDMGGVSNPMYIAFDSSERAMRYDFPDRSAMACTSEFTPAVMPRELTVTGPNLWLRFTSKESAGFAHGLPNCGGRSYKFFLVTFEQGGNLKGRAGLYLGDGSGTSPHIATRLYLDFNTLRDTSLNSGPRLLDIGGDVSWGGIYHEWTIGIEGVGTSTATLSAYLDGRLVGKVDGPFLRNQLGPWTVMFEMGANINSGPPNAQSRWWRRFDVFASKPAGIP